MVDRYLDSDDEVHAGNVGGNDYTLCGLAFEEAGYDMTPVAPTKRLISCGDCIAMIMFCKAIRSREIEGPRP